MRQDHVAPGVRTTNVVLVSIEGREEIREMSGDKSADRFIRPEAVFPVGMPLPPACGKRLIPRGQVFGFPELMDDFRNGHVGRTVGIKDRVPTL